MSDLSEIRRWHSEHPSATSWTWRAVDTLLRTVNDHRNLLDGVKVYTQGVEKQRDQLAAIVRAVAAFTPQVDADSYPVQCLFCDAEFDLPGSQRPDLHDPECLWRRACEWVAAHPEGAARP